MGTDLAIARYGGGFKTKRPSSGLWNNVFMYTVNMAAKTLVSAAQTSNYSDEDTENNWKTTDHLRFMLMLMTWLTVWVLRVLMDHFPISYYLPCYSLGGGSFSALDSTILSSAASSSSSALALPSFSTSSSSFDFVLYEEVDAPSVNALSRSLTHILALLNEMPATSSKYQFAMTMAEKIMEGNARHDHVELLEVNRAALSSAFARTSSLLYRSMQSTQSQDDDGSIGWPLIVFTINALPFGSYVVPYVKGLSSCFNTVLSWVDNKKRNNNNEGGGGGGALGGSAEEEYGGEVMAEKLAQELLWITNKLRAYGALEHAIVQWSCSSGPASLSLTASPRVQGLIVKISALLVGDLNQEESEIITREVKFKLLVLWLPLFCHAGNGLTYPVLSSFEKFETERTMNDVISSLPAMDQEVILTNWVQDSSIITASNWPDLQPSYERWCHSARQLVA